MADVSVRMGVSGISQFKNGMKEAQESVKTLDAALKANEKSFKQSGNAEEHMAAQTNLLSQKLKEQQKIVKNAQDALKQMEQNGVKTTSVSYQKMQRQLIEAQSGMMDTQAALDGMGAAAEDAAGKTDNLSASLGGLNKKVSLDQVITGLDKITSGMEKAAKKAVDLGKEIWNMAMESARYSDDIATQATILGMDPETYQQYKGVFDTIAEVTVQEWATAKRKIEKAMVDPSKDQIDVLEALGLVGKEGVDGGNGSLEQEIKLAAGNWEDAFWQIAGELQTRLADGRLTEEMADVYGEAIFGKKFSNLKPLIQMGRDAFLEALGVQNVMSEEAIKKNAELNDKIIELQNSFKSLQGEVMSGLAPALTDAANALNGLLGSVLDYLKTPEGKEALESMGKAVSGLFDDLGKISPDQVVDGFAKVFGDIVNGVTWLKDNWEGVKIAIEGIGGAFLVMKGAEEILNLVKVIDGIKGLAGGAAAAEGAAAGAAWGSAFANAVAAAAPWLIGVYTLLNPAGSAKDNIDTLYQNGQLTQAGMEYWQNNLGVWEARQNAIAQRYGDFASLMGDEKAVQIMLDPTINDEDVFKRLEEELGLQPKTVEIPAELKLPGDMASQLAAEVGTVSINGTIYLTGVNGDIEGVSSDWLGIGSPTGTKRKRPSLLPYHEANGIWSVPFDGFNAVLHKGERVVPARAVNSSRNFSSNLYVESMYMNNGTDAAGLAAAMAAAQRRTMSGFGS